MALRRYRWPGNIRELKNILERAVLLSGDNQMELNLPAEVQGKEDHPFADSPSLEEVQRRYIHDVLKRTGGRIAGPGGAAEILGMKRTTLYSRMRALGMSRLGNRVSARDSFLLPLVWSTALFCAYKKIDIGFYCTYNLTYEN